MFSKSMRIYLRLLWVSILILMISNTNTNSVYANVSEINTKNISIQLEYIDIYMSEFSISREGIATGVTVVSSSNVDEIHIYGSVQQLIGDKWISIGSWSNKTRGTDCGLNKSISVNSGFNYRYKSTIYLYKNGKLVETNSITSSIVKY